jgi:superfamily II DNA or RNA helicase
LKDKEVTKTCAILNVSSEQLDDFQSTTEPADIRKFTVARKSAATKMKIVCVTYQSLQVLLDNLGDAKVGLACFDEAHRTTSPKYSKLVYSDEYRAKYEKQVFFTATPVNANGITMFDRERDEMGTYGDCGPLASEYTYLQGLCDDILSLFELRVDLYTQDTLGNMYESIARAILTTGNTRVLTFHADTAEDSKSETSVLQFVDKAKFMESFRSVCAKDFPDKVGKFTASNVTFTAITAETKNKDEILGAFEICADDEIYIVSSCRTIGEGVDTKKANMCVFVDPKSSVISIIQNIGRICRKIAGTDRQPATILIPVCIGWEKYVAAGDDAEKQDGLIREQLNDRENGDYNAIMNIVAALKQEDPELYELCLRYPSNFTEAERKHALEEQGFRVLEDDACEYADLEPNVLYPAEIDKLVEDGERVEIHTSKADVPIVYRGFDEEEEEERPIHRFYEIEEENDDGEMETRYHRIAPVNEDGDEDLSRRLTPPKTTNRPRMNIHTNDEIKLLWRMGDVTLGDQFGSAVLECEVEQMDTVERWKENHQKMCEFIVENGGAAPSSVSKNPEEKRLGRWTSTQKYKYNPNGSEFSKHGMKTNPDTWQIWRDTLADPRYIEALKRQTPEDPVQDWKNKHKNMCEFIDSKKKAPSQCAKDFAEKTLGKWVNSQKNNHSNSKGIMKNQEILKIWTETLIDPKYSEALKRQTPEDPVQDWKNKHKNMCEFINSTKKGPSQTAKDIDEKTMGIWTRNQKKNHNPQGTTCSKCIMKTNPEVWKIWTDTLADPRYGGVLADPDQDWKNKHTQMCDYISKNGRLPRQKDHEEKTLRIWIDTQKKNHNPLGNACSKCIMKTNPEVWKIWIDTLADPRYGGVLADPAQDWKNKHTQMCDYISKNIKLPTQTTKEPAEKVLRQWADTQKKTYDPLGAEFSNQIMKTNPEIWQIWTDTLADPKYHAALNAKTGRRANAPMSHSPSPSPPPPPPPPQEKPRSKVVSKKSHLIPKSTPESSLECASSTNLTKRDIADSDYKLTGRAWATQKSSTTHENLQSNPAEWHAYHAARDISFQGYVDQSQIPRNRVIANLGTKCKHRLRILDLGCGRNNIARHYADEKKFTIQGYDHVVEEGSGALIGNIADLAAQEEDENADICIYSQSLMGSDWPNYLTEGHRMLRYNGEFIISEHIKMLDDVRAELGRLGCKVESVDADASAKDADASDDEANDKVAKWFVLIARKV